MRELFKRLGIVLIFSIAMAWVESSVVVYLRTPIDRVIPYQIDPLPISVGLGWIGIVREAATLVMLLTVGWLAGRTWRSRLSYTLIAFGAWDIFYYIFLVPMCGWPTSLLDWDVLFLIPLPWWGPVLAPVFISILMIIGGLDGRPDRADTEACLAAMVGMDIEFLRDWPCPVHIHAVRIASN